MFDLCECVIPVVLGGHKSEDTVFIFNRGVTDGCNFYHKVVRFRCITFRYHTENKICVRKYLL